MENKKETLQLQLRVDEVNLIFKALGRMPFQEVYELIGKINIQVNDQIPFPGKGQQASDHFKLNSDINT